MDAAYSADFDAMDAAFFAEFNAVQSGHKPRPLFLRAQQLAGPGHGRLAIDVGCGPGNETAAMIWNGWRVLAIDRDPASAARVHALGVKVAPGDLDVRTVDFADVTWLPSADLVYAGYSLPFAGPAIPALWAANRAALNPGGWLAVHLFARQDGSLTTGPSHHLVSRQQALELLDGLELFEFGEREQDAPIPNCAKSWHTFHVIARRPATASVGSAGSSRSARWL